jgi:fructoselysine-6-P-deglycase FrlB-like protein
MGASHFAALPTWRRMVARGKSTVWIQTANLLNQSELITSDSLVIATSRSGACPELITLLNKFDDGESIKPSALVAITDNLASPLAAAADGELLMRSQLSTSQSGFLNALAAHDYVASLILNEDNDDVATTAHIVAATTFPEILHDVAAAVAVKDNSVVVYMGFGEHAATALYAEMLTRKITDVDVASYRVDQQPSRPLQHVGAHVTTILFGSHDAIDRAVSHRLVTELISTGSTVIVVGAADHPSAHQIPSPSAHLSAQVAHGVLIAEKFVSYLAEQSQRS